MKRLTSKNGAMDPKVEAYIKTLGQWQLEMEQLRNILLGSELRETLKWGKPCYTFNGQNVAIIQGFKKFCALMFFKGTLLKDPHKVLQQQGENTQAALRIPFTSKDEIVSLKPILIQYVKEAIAVEKSGLKVAFNAKNQLELADELQMELAENSQLKKAFQSLTPGKQRAYNLYISGAKRPETRRSRIKKCIPKILSGKGLNEPV